MGSVGCRVLCHLFHLIKKLYAKETTKYHIVHFAPGLIAIGESESKLTDADATKMNLLRMLQLHSKWMDEQTSKKITNNLFAEFDICIEKCSSCFIAIALFSELKLVSVPGSESYTYESSFLRTIVSSI